MTDFNESASYDHDDPSSRPVYYAGEGELWDAKSVRPTDSTSRAIQIVIRVNPTDEAANLTLHAGQRVKLTITYEPPPPPPMEPPSLKKWHPDQMELPVNEPDDEPWPTEDKSEGVLAHVFPGGMP